MAQLTVKGSLLTRNWRDTSAGIELEFWFSTADGPLCARVQGERSVFFLAKDQLTRARELLSAETAVEVKPVELRNFQLTAVAGIYFNSHRQARRCAERLRSEGLEPLEATGMNLSSAPN